MLTSRTVDDVALSISHLRGSGRAPVVCLHAMMTDGRYFGARKPDGFAHMLAALGHDVFVADFRGHGDSQRVADWSFDDLVELDLPAIIAACARESGRAPSELIVLGHSLGGLVATAAIGTARIPAPQRLVLAATSVWLRGSRRRRAIMETYRASAQLFGRAPIRALRLGTSDEARTYVEQLTGWTRSGRWTSLRGIDYAAATETITTPVQPICGAGDWMCTPRDAAQFVGRIASAAPLRVVGRARGDALDPDHFALFTRSELAAAWRGLFTAE